MLPSQVGHLDAGELTAGAVLADRFELIGPLAFGGMGQVWAARNLTTQAEVAVKVLHPEHASSPAGLARFRREAQATATLCHRAIVRVFDLVELDPGRGSLIMVMELLRGHTLAREIEAMGPLSVAQTLQIVFPLLSALEHAHGLGIVHRDLKPENIFLAVEPDGQTMPKVVDFGISKLLRASPITLDGQVLGTMSYMSPEQAMGAPVDARSDIFALGILLYECLTGRNPFVAAPTPRGSCPSFELGASPEAGIPGAIWRIIARALATRAADRFTSVAELTAALRAAAPVVAIHPDGCTVRSRAIAPAPAARPRWRRIAGAVAVATAGIITAASAAPSTRTRPVHQASLAEATRPVSAAMAHEKHFVACLDVVAAAPSRAGEEEIVPPPGPLLQALRDARMRAWGRKRAGRGRGVALVLRDPGF